MKKVFAKIGSSAQSVPFLRSIAEIMGNPSISKRVYFTLGVIVLYRFMANIPPPGIDVNSFIDAFEGNTFTPILWRYQSKFILNMPVVVADA